MFLQARTRGICQGCRYDLQILFERGFCTTTAFARNRRKHFTRPTQSDPSKRSLSRTSRLLEVSRPQIVEPNESENQDDTIENDTISTAEEAFLERLEKELGKPLEQAIRDDEISAEQLLSYKTALDIARSQEIVKETSESRVATLRSLGAPSADVVREARLWHGDTLPGGLLDEEELALYKRLYGEPVTEETPQPEHETSGFQAGVAEQNRLFSAEGAEIEFTSPTDQTEQAIKLFNWSPEAKSVGGKEMQSYLEEEELEDDEYDDETTGSGPVSDRSHPLTAFGKFRTTPRTVFLSQKGFVKPAEKIMSNYSNKHLKEVCEKTFGGPGLPDSPLTPRSGRSRQQVPIPLDVSQNTMGEMEANAYVSAVMPPTYASVISVLVETRKRLGSTWLSKLLSREGGPRILDAGGAGVGILAWREIVQAHWNSLHTSDKKAPPPPASKSVVVTGSDGLRHRSAEMLENTTFIPRLPDYVHSRDTPTLEDNRPTQQRKQFDVIIAPHILFALKEDWMRKQYVQNLWMMLSNEGGVLILIEKGIPRGFEAIAGAREMLLDRYVAVPPGVETHYSKSHSQQLGEDGIHKKEPAMIVAPCTNHEKCPMYTNPGLSRGRKDICSFQQRYIRPAFLQRILGAKDRNHDDVDFSYLSIMKGDDLRLNDTSTWTHVLDPVSAPKHSEPTVLASARRAFMQRTGNGFEHFTPDSTSNVEEKLLGQLPSFGQMPRMINPPIKRRGHVTMDLCTPAGKIERWTVPRSFSKQAYRDARKAKWGDIWALGAKTRIDRNLKLGSPEKSLTGKDGRVIRDKGRGSKERAKLKAMQLMEEDEEQRQEDLMEKRDFMAAMDEDFETDPDLLRDPETTSTRSSISKSTSGRPNNRERKALRRAARAAAATSRDTPDTSDYHADGADLTFKPRAASLEKISRQ